MTDPMPPSALSAPLFSSAAMRAILDDRARLQRMLDFEAALARAEAAVGVIPALCAGDIAGACRAERFDIAELVEAAVAAGDLATPLIAALTAEVAKRNADSANYVHWGASNQDLIDTALALELRAAIDALIADLDRAIKTFTSLAGRHRRTTTLVRTALQQAMPMPFGLRAAGYAAALARARDRLRRVRREALALQFGGSAGTLAALGEHGIEVSSRIAALIDLPHPDAPWHSHRDRLADIASSFAILAGSCGKIARDIALLMQSEIGELAQRATESRGGGTVPQQRMLAAAGHAVACAAAAPGLASTVLAAQSQEHERGIAAGQSEWLTFPALALATSGALQAVAELAEGIEVDVERVRANFDANGGQAFAEAVALALVPKLGRAQAQELIAELGRKAIAEKRPLQQVLAADERIAAQLDAAALDRLFMPMGYHGSAQTFLDRLVASTQFRHARRSTDMAPVTELRPGIAATPRSPEPAAPAEPPAIAAKPASEPPTPEPTSAEPPKSEPPKSEPPNALSDAFARVADAAEQLARPPDDRERKPA